MSSTTYYYYCYNCESRKNSASGYRCPTCNSGFVELLEDRPESETIQNVQNVTNEPNTQNSQRNDLNMLLTSRSPPLSASINEIGGPLNILSQSTRPLSSYFETRNRLSNMMSGRRSPPLSLSRNELNLPPNANFPNRVNPQQMISNLMNFFRLNTLLRREEGESLEGLTEEEINRLPIVVLSQENLDKNPSCTICLENFTLAQEVLQLRDCDHPFHKGCIELWLKKKSSCPVCRTPMNFDSSYILDRSIELGLLDDDVPENPVHMEPIHVGQINLIPVNRITPQGNIGDQPYQLPAQQSLQLYRPSYVNHSYHDPLRRRPNMPASTFVSTLAPVRNIENVEEIIDLTNLPSATVSSESDSDDSTASTASTNFFPHSTPIVDYIIIDSDSDDE